MSASFGDKLSNARLKTGLTQKQLAARLRISPQYLNDIEHDRRNPPNNRLIEELSFVLNIETDILYLWAGRIPPDVWENIEQYQEALLRTIMSTRLNAPAGRIASYSIYIGKAEKR